MLTLISLATGALVVLTLPHWLPAAVLALRTRIFTRINGEEGLAIPGKLVAPSHFKRLYSHPASNGRSRGAALSDLFWYWLSPGPELHQEHLEAGERYDEVARTTRRILAIPKKAAQELAVKCAGRFLDDLNLRDFKLVRLRDLVMPIWADFYYELVFGETCPSHVRKLIVGNANDVVTALKCCSLRHMERRHRLTAFLAEKLKTGSIPQDLPTCLTRNEQALYLQGTFFNTAVVQMSEAMVHLLMVVAHHQDIQARLVGQPEEDRYFDYVIDETLRLYPLFGISHRITSADIPLNEMTTIPKGTVLCFKHPEFHRAGFIEPEKFNPERWVSVLPHEVNYVPFGVSANRACPAGGIALVTMRVVATELLKRFAVYSSASHTRSIPNRGPCLLAPRKVRLNGGRRRWLLLFLRLRDRWENVGRSVVQLILGTYMVWDARRLRLCQRYFESSVNPSPARGRGSV